MVHDVEVQGVLRAGEGARWESGHGETVRGVYVKKSEGEGEGQGEMVRERARGRRGCMHLQREVLSVQSPFQPAVVEFVLTAAKQGVCMRGEQGCEKGRGRKIGLQIGR